MYFGLFVFLLSLPLPSASATSERHICGPYYYKAQGVFDRGGLFSKNDDFLICGSEAPGWETVPESQALFHIKTKLNSLGYFSPSVERANGRIVVDLGPLSTIKKIIFKNEPRGFKDRIFQGYKNQSMTPSALENAKNWTEARLRSMGYPCPEVQVHAGYENEILEVDMLPGPKQRLVELHRPDTPELKSEVYARYDAFQFGGFFNADKLALSSRRLLEDEIVDFTHFEDRCGPDGAIVHQKAILGRPRSLVFGIGASTEELPILKVDWRNVRIDEFGSSTLVSLYASPRLQSFKAGSNLYWFRNLPALYLSPNAEFRRESEFTYKAFRQRFQFGVGHINDDSGHRYIFNYSPTYTVEKTLEGQGPQQTQYFSFQTTVQLISHYFEFYRFAPQEGYQVTFNWEAQRDNIGSSFTADLLKINGTFLWNLGNTDPPLTVFGLRFGHSILTTPDMNALPASYRLFLGGAENVRGFFRQAVNNDNRGFQTTSFLGTEVRFLEVLPYKLQPLLFYDIAKVGFHDWSWSRTLYMSPGVGVRWQSPLGAVRGTFGKGMVANADRGVSQPPQDWTLFLSYGREF